VQLTVLAKRAFPKFTTRPAIRRAVYFPLDVLTYFLAGATRYCRHVVCGLWFVGGGHFRGNQFLS
jgi:hypothetical protein